MGFQQITRNSSKMKVFVVFALIAVAASAPADEWSNFKKTYNKVYRSYEEEQFRKSVFAETLAFINEHNAKYEQGLYTFDTAINERADWTQEEWESILTAKVPERSREEPAVFASAPDSHDFREPGPAPLAPSLTFPSKSLLTAEMVTVMEDGPPELTRPSLLREDRCWDLTTPTLLRMDGAIMTAMLIPRPRSLHTGMDPL